MQHEEQLPQCIGFILDGNRRWARNKNLPTLKGHSKGLKVFQDIIQTVHEKGIPHMVAYLFSTENWNRSEKEIQYLMILFKETLSRIIKDLQNGENKIRVRVIGDLKRLPSDLQSMVATIESTWDEKKEPKLTVWAAVSYGGRAEVVNAAQSIAQSGEGFSEDAFSTALWTKDMPDPDMIIRTGGELRLSNFLLWQAAYSELFFTDTLWPDFGAEEFQSMLEEYAKRQRRRGQ